MGQIVSTANLHGDCSNGITRSCTHWYVNFLSCFAIISLRKKIYLVALLFIFFLLPDGCRCSLPLPRGAVGWSVVCLWHFLVIFTCFLKVLASKKTKTFCDFSWVVTSTGPGGFMVCVYFMTGAPEGSPKVVLERNKIILTQIPL